MICLDTAKMLPHAPMEAWPDGKKPWSRLYAEFAEPRKKISLLILVDSYLKWPKVFQMKSSNESSTIQALEKKFSRFGLPETLVTQRASFSISRVSNFMSAA